MIVRRGSIVWSSILCILKVENSNMFREFPRPATRYFPKRGGGVGGEGGGGNLYLLQPWQIGED